MDKIALIDFLIQQQDEKIGLLQAEMNRLRSDLEDDTKSSVGDKHETSRAMVQLEMEKLGKHLEEIQKSMTLLGRLKSNPTAPQIGVGSLVFLEKSIFFISIGLGKISFNGQMIFCISPQAPIYSKLLNRKVGDWIDLPQSRDQIKTIL